MHTRYKNAWDDLQSVLSDTGVPNKDFRESLEEMISDLQSQLDAAKSDTAAEGEEED